jgi:hypothetical protein
MTLLPFRKYLRLAIVANNKSSIMQEKSDFIFIHNLFGNFSNYRFLIIRPPFLSKKFIDAGLIILSRYPIVERDGIVFDFGNQIDSWAAKQVIYAKVKKNISSLNW